MPVVAETQTGIDRHHANDEGDRRRKPPHHTGSGDGPQQGGAPAEGEAPTVGTLIDVRA
jgi:hypothetical protein